jgi:hypothetical protein
MGAPDYGSEVARESWRRPSPILAAECGETSLWRIHHVLLREGSGIVGVIW